MGIELGLPPGIDSHSAQVIIQAAVGELPVIARLPLDRVNDLAQAAIHQLILLQSAWAPLEDP